MGRELHHHPIWFLLDRQNTLKSSLKRIWVLELELLFWSLALFAATLFLRKAGLYSGSVLKLAAHSVLPLTTSLWWYPTSYAMFLLLLQFLVTGMKALGERAHRSLSLIALLMWGIAGLLPFTRNDLHGGSVLVFVYWFVLLSYYRWYMERIRAAICWKLILAGLGIEVVYCLAFSLVFAMTGKGAGFQFFIFDNWKIPSMPIGFGLFELLARREFHSRCVNCLAGSAFGVYLVHYHPAVKALWMNWLPLDKLYLSAHPLAAITVCVLAIFACCLALDLVRQGLFAMTVDRNRNRGRWFELVWNKFTERTKPMPVHTGQHIRKNEHGRSCQDVPVRQFLRRLCLGTSMFRGLKLGEITKPYHLAEHWKNRDLGIDVDKGLLAFSWR